MRGRLSMSSLYNVNPLIPGIRRSRVAPSVAYPAKVIIEGRTPKLNAADRMIINATERWVPRRWPQTLADDLEPIIPRTMPEYTPLQVPSATAAAPSGGFWSNIASGLSNAVAGVLPAFAQVQAARLMTTQNAALLRQAGTQLYTPGNIQTLQQQAEFEAAQRRINEGRLTGATSLPISGTMLAVLGVGGLALYLALKK